ncbi:MAG: acetylglutamate kinase [Deinococcus sp.]|nr:acetylglutamate kinase [Deinococcus sp.]
MPSPSLLIKLGGSTLTSVAAIQAAAQAIAALQASGYQPVVVHGGGPEIQAWLKRLNIESRFERGLRVTSPAAMEVIEMALGRLSKDIAAAIGAAVGLSGKDAGTVRCRPLDAAVYGLVGEITRIEPALLYHLVAGGFVPVLSCIALGEDGLTYNVNADMVAGAVAGVLQIPAVFISDVPGVLRDPKDRRSLLPQLSAAQVAELIAQGIISGGMIPKVEAALEAVRRGAPWSLLTDHLDAAALAAQKHRGTRLHPS